MRQSNYTMLRELLKANLNNSVNIQVAKIFCEDEDALDGCIGVGSEHPPQRRVLIRTAMVLGVTAVTKPEYRTSLL